MTPIMSSIIIKSNQDSGHVVIPSQKREHSKLEWLKSKLKIRKSNLTK